MGKMTLQGFVTTTDPIDAYGGIQLDPQVMHFLADAIREGRTPWNAQHDQRLHMKPRVITVDVREAGNGALGVWVELEIEEEDWFKYGELGGFSLTLVESYLKPRSGDPGPPLRIAADAYHFNDSDLRAVAASLEDHFSVYADRLYQFSELPEARVVIEMSVAVIQSLGPNVVASALYDAFKHFLRGPSQIDQPAETDFSLSVTEEPGRITRQASFKTNNDDHLKRILDKLPELMRPELEGKNLEFDRESEEWKELS